MSKMNVMMSTLHLVYPPVSSYEADHVKRDSQVEERLRSSDFYMMAMRAEVRFEDVDDDGLRWKVRVTGKNALGQPIIDYVTLDVEQLAANTLGAVPDAMCAEVGPKLIRLWPGSEEDFKNGRIEEPFEWFTTEKLLHDMRRGVLGLTGLKRLRDFSMYDLLYVGIAKRTDTFTRLFEDAHHARQKILSVEWPRREGARVADELIMFPFRVEPTLIRTLATGNDWTDMSNDAWRRYKKRVVADAEKAFIRMLDPLHNIEKFRNYPRGPTACMKATIRRTVI
jgi:hypothetical protein